jgi:hypothetical protein
MPKTLHAGSQGPDVKTLQARLNAAMPLAKPPLAVDGIFGPLTLARVKAFQQSKGLAVDGIVGPLTWGALEKGQTPGYSSGWANCGCAYAHSSGIPPVFHKHASTVAAPALQQGGAQYRFRNASFAADAAPRSDDGFKIYRVTDAQRSVLDPVYGDSISYVNVFMTNKTGMNDRAFVLTVPAPIGGRYTAIQYVNIGQTYSNHTLVHEFGHVWEAQHHSSPTAYMINALASQGAEEVANAAGGTDKWSAYAYVPGRNFALYGAEQIAQMIANGESDIVDRVKNTPKFALDILLLPSPGVPFIEKKGEPGVKS